MALLIEILSVLFGIAYVVLAAKRNIWCWLMGIIASVLSIVLFAHYSKLYAEALLSVYYVLTGILGWLSWNKKSENIKVERASVSKHVLAILISVAGAFLLNYLINYLFKDAERTLLDSFTTSFSFVATFLTIKRWLSNWIYWIVIDAFTVYLYFSQELYIYALLMVAYTVIAYYGWKSWRLEYEKAH
jgi:nicotinamide mononucleotide transporter